MREININEINKFLSDSNKFEEDFAFVHITSGLEKLRKASDPFRFSGMMIVLCRQGNMSLDIDMNNYRITPNSILMSRPDCIIQPRSFDGGEADIYVFLLSVPFLRDINFDLNAIHSHSSHFLSQQEKRAVFSLTQDESDLLCSYLDLFYSCMKNNDDSIYSKNVFRNLVASMFYQMFQWRAKYYSPEEDRPRSRKVNYVHDFLELVGKYHKQERAVGFYADKMFISPKYLSLIVKEVTKRSAAAWIDEFVILEAKNLLRFSGKNIQQISYELNFTNQSSFGKYFKHLTGMSPSEFQKS